MPARWSWCVSVLAGALASAPAWAACSFRVDFIDVGQGDAAFVQTPDCKTALIDGGDAGSGVPIRAHLASIGVTAIDLGIVSHYHQDHVAGFVEIGQSPRIPVTTVLDRGGSYSSAVYSSYASLYSGKRRTPVLGEVIALGSQVKLTVIAVNTLTGDENARSLGVKLTYGELDILFAGDAGMLSGKDSEARIGPRVGPIEIYKVDHHGSAEASGDTLLSLTQPDASIISCGRNNSFGHPDPEALDRLSAWSDVWQTEDPDAGVALGTITVRATSGGYTVTQGAETGTYTTFTDAPGQVQVPTATNIYTGSTTATLPALGADDSTRWLLTAGATTGGYKTDWYAQFKLPRTTPRTLTIAWNGRSSASRDQTVKIYDRVGSRWVTLRTEKVGTGDQTLFWVVPSPSRYVSATGLVNVRFSSPVTTSTYSVSTDAVWAVWEP